MGSPGALNAGRNFSLFLQESFRAASPRMRLIFSCDFQQHYIANELMKLHKAVLEQAFLQGSTDGVGGGVCSGERDMPSVGFCVHGCNHPYREEQWAFGTWLRDGLKCPYPSSAVSFKCQL